MRPVWARLAGLNALLWSACDGAAPPAPPAAEADCEILAPAGPVVRVGQALTFSAKNPDSRYDYRWSFDDGQEAVGTTVRHTFTAPVRVHVQLKLRPRSELPARSCSALQIAHGEMPALPSSNCSTIVADAPRRRVWVVNPDSNTVTAIDAERLVKIGEYPVGLRPQTLARAADGSIWVANQDSYDVRVLAGDSGALVATIPLPHHSQPYCVAFSPDGKRAYVTLQALGRLVEVDAAARKLTSRSLDFAHTEGIVPKIRGLAITSDSRRALVTRFISLDAQAEIYDVALTEAGALSYKTIPLLAVPPGRHDLQQTTFPGVPNYLSLITIRPDGAEAWVASKQDNVFGGEAKDARGKNVRTGKALIFDSTMRAIVSRIDLTKNTELPQTRIDIDDEGFPFAAAFSPLGDLAFVSLQGSGSVHVMSAGRSAQLTAFSGGVAPQGMTMLGGRLFVQSFMSRMVVVEDLREFLTSEAPPPPAVRIQTVAKELMTPQEVRGKQLFYTSADPRITNRRYISCAGCHLEGGQDGRVWDFTDRGEGLRNTTALLGGGAGTGRIHWTGNFDEFQDFENDMRAGFGGTGFLTQEQWRATRDTLGAKKAGLSPELDALAAFLQSLKTFPPSPYKKPDGSLTAEGIRGQTVFARAKCGKCHDPAANFTSSKGDGSDPLYDVGTATATSGQRLRGKLNGFDTPTLRGIWATAPYLHDGSAKTLRQVLDGKKHIGAPLTTAQKADLISYLMQLD